MATKIERPRVIAGAHPMYTTSVPILEQIRILEAVLRIDASPAKKFAAQLSRRPEIPEPYHLQAHLHWCAFPSVMVIGPRWYPNVSKPFVREMQCTAGLVKCLKKRVAFTAMHNGEMHTERRTNHALEILAEQQPGDIFIVAVQRGVRYLGESSERVISLLSHGEYPFTVWMGLAMALTHTHLMNKENPFCLEFPGTRVLTRNNAASLGRNRYTETPFMRFHRGRTVFSSTHSGNKDVHAGAATFFLPDSAMVS